MKEDYAVSKVHLAADGVDESFSSGFISVPSFGQFIDIIMIFAFYPNTGSGVKECNGLHSSFNRCTSSFKCTN